MTTQSKTTPKTQPKTAPKTAPRAAREKPSIINGINAAAVFEKVAAVRDNPELASFRFRLSNRWTGADRSRSSIDGYHGGGVDHAHDQGPFVVDSAEPSSMQGSGTAPNPVEFLLHALVSCLTTTIVFHAAARGITIGDMTTEVEGEMDMRGYLGLSGLIRKGFSRVRVSMTVTCDATPETLVSLAEYSPVYDIVSKSLPIALTVTTR
ncbi:MAG: OsmC family protein [Alphaproteobacteria bacterium]|nr:OsmC family protein [Alphaproteobacteria bacterium]